MEALAAKYKFKLHVNFKIPSQCFASRRDSNSKFVGEGGMRKKEFFYSSFVDYDMLDSSLIRYLNGNNQLTGYFHDQNYIEIIL